MDRDFNSSESFDIIRTITSSWNDQAGDNRYYLNIFRENEDGERRKIQEIDGDAEWAGRIAAHYNLKIPKGDR